MNRYKIKGVIIILISAFIFLQACKVTQMYHTPPQDVNTDSLYRDVNNKDSNNIANLSWRQLFSPKLKVLIGEAIQNNYDLKVAEARIKQAQADFKQSELAFLPSLDANASAEAQKLSDAQQGQTTNNTISRTHIYQLYASASWEADIWGQLKSSKRAALAALLQSEAYKRYVQTQLISQIAINYYSLLAYDAQLDVTIKTVANRKEDVSTVQALKNSDAATGADVVQAEANRYSAEVTIPDIKQNIRQAENAICVLLGRTPGTIDRDSLSHETVVSDLPAGVPSQLLANRPDIQEAEFQLQNAFELTNVARSYFYPALTITAEGGWYKNVLSGFFSPGYFFANIIGGLTQPIFNKGLNKQRLAKARAVQEEYLATYKKTWLTAGQEISDALYQYQSAQDKIAVRSNEISNLLKAVDYTEELMKNSYQNYNYTNVLTAEQNLLSAQLNSITDKLQQLQAVVSLYVGLGGGWK
ncbi:MAG: efflux transporter outer membrane subunit [Arachidicoccus sp.]|nr:efflux transporter outer membrane subunit [Arachidicoccus sp.]